VGGFFTKAGSIPVNFIARWDGQSWHDVGGGVEWEQGNSNAVVYAMASWQGNLLVGGRFLSAGGNRSIHHFANWKQSTWASIGPILSFVDGQYRLLLTDVLGRTYGIEASSNMVDWTRLTTFTNIGAVTEFIDRESAQTRMRFYRAVIP
jgi:hypothetical protein